MRISEGASEEALWLELIAVGRRNDLRLVRTIRAHHWSSLPEQELPTSQALPCPLSFRPRLKLRAALRACANSSHSCPGCQAALSSDTPVAEWTRAWSYCWP